VLGGGVFYTTPGIENGLSVAEATCSREHGKIPLENFTTSRGHFRWEGENF